MTFYRKIYMYSSGSCSKKSKLSMKIEIVGQVRQVFGGYVLLCSLCSFVSWTLIISDPVYERPANFYGCLL